MKICILSMQKVENYGSLLQCYALKKLLEEMGNTVKFIDIEHRPNDDMFMKDHRILFIEEFDKCKKNKYLNKLRKIDKYLLNRIKNKLKLQKQLKIFESFRKTKLEILDSDNMEDYDVCVIGSDEVFNCTIQSEWGFTSQLFGEITQSKKVITYAASCGSTFYYQLPNLVSKEIKEAFSRVSAFSVRDKNTYEFVEKLTNKKIFSHYDPVVISDFSEEIEKSGELSFLPERFCAVYSYYNRIHSNDEINAIKKLCIKHSLNLISLGSPQMWIRNHFVLTPFELLKAFSKAEFIITDTFHGTIFASKYANKFVIIARKSNENKLIDLIEKIEKRQHLVERMDEIEKVYNIKNDLVKLKNVQISHRMLTKQYFQDNLS